MLEKRGQKVPSVQLQKGESRGCLRLHFVYSETCNAVLWLQQQKVLKVQISDSVGPPAEFVNH